MSDVVTSAWSSSAGYGFVSPLIWVSHLVLVACVDAGSVEPDPLPVLENTDTRGAARDATVGCVLQSTRIVRACATPCV